MTAVEADRVVEWDRDRLAAAADEVLDVYAEAMGVPRLATGGRRSILTGHLDRRGLRAVGCREQRGRLVGVAYGHLGEPGQWWHDQVQLALTGSLGAREAAGWLGSFEVCELHVRPAWQGRGLGRELLERLLAGSSAGRALLTTPDSETRARGFYRTAGWVDLARQLRFPGDPRLFAVLGLRAMPGHDRPDDDPDDHPNVHPRDHPHDHSGVHPGDHSDDHSGDRPAGPPAVT